MPLLNNQPNQIKPPGVGRTPLVIGVVAVVVILAIIAVVASLPKSPTTSTSTSYVDPNSHQTVSNPTNKAPETYGTSGTDPIFLGTSPLLDHGLSAIQLDDLRTAFINYSNQQATHLKEVSINVDSIADGAHDTSGPTITDTITFKVVLDRTTTYKAQFVYHDINNGRLYLSNTTTNKVVFDSGDISPDTYE